MNRTKKLIALIGVLIGVCVFTLFIRHYENEKITAHESEILSFHSDDIKEIKWTIDGETYAFYKEDQWYSVSDKDFPVDEEKMENLLDSLSSVVSTFKIEDVNDYQQYGLKEPKCSIEITTDKTYTIKLGNYSTMDEERYASIDDGNVYLLKNDLMETFDCTLDDIIKLEDIPSMKQIISFHVTGDTSLSILYKENSGYCYSDEYVYFLNNDDQYEALDKSDCEDYMNTIKNMEWSGYETYKLDEKDLKKFGLDDPNYCITIHYLNKEDETQELKLSFSQKNNQYYVRIDESSYVYTIDSSIYDTIKDTKAEDLKTRKVLFLNWDHVQRIDMSLDDTNYTVKMNHDGDEITYSFVDKNIDFNDVIDHIKTLEMSSFTLETPSKRKELTLTVYQNNQHYPKITIEFYQYDGESCLVVFDQQPIGLISRESVVELKESIQTIVLDQ